MNGSNIYSIIANPVTVNPLQAMGTAVQTAGGITDLRQKQFNLQQAQLGPAYQAMRQVMATNPNPTDDDVNAALAQSARIGANIDGLAANYSDFRARGGTPGDWVRATALGGMSPERQGELVGPRQQGFQTGAGTVYGTMGGPWSATAGQFQPGGFIAEGLTPGQATEFVTVQGPDGRSYQVPRGTLFGSGAPGGGGMPIYGGGGGGSGAGGGGTALLPPGAPDDVAAAKIDQIGWRESRNQNIQNQQGPGGSPLSTASGPYQFLDSTWQQAAREYGIQNPTQRAMQTDPAIQRAVAIKFLQNHGEAPWAQSAPGGGGGGPFIGATGAQPVGGGGMQYFGPTGQPMAPGGGWSFPGVTRGPGGAPILTPPAPWMGPIWEQSAKEYSGDVSREAGLASRIQPWQSALSIINAHPDLKTGPTSQQWNNWATTLSQWGVQLPSMPGDSVAAYQELSKSLHQGLVNSGVFSGTDMARLEAEASSPNPQMQVEAVKELSARQIGYERFQMAKLKYFRSLHPGEDPDQYANQYRQQTSTWASNLDPVAFGADHLSDQEIATYLKGLNSADQQRFWNSIKEASKLYPDFAKAGKK